MTIEDTVLRVLHRSAAEAGRKGVSIPSVDLEAASRHAGSRGSAEQAIARLIRSKRVIRVRRDLLVLPDSMGLIGVGLPDLIDASAPRPYLITGGAALQQFDLTDQHYFGLAVLVPSEVTRLSFRGQSARFFKTDPVNIWGYDPAERFRIALPERALVDALNHPRYGVSLTQSLDALIRAEKRDPHFLDRLHAVVQRYSAGSKGHGSRSSARRVGLVVEQLFGADAASPYRELIGTNRSPVLLRPGAPPTGPVDTTWRVVLNAILEPELVA